MSSTCQAKRARKKARLDKRYLSSKVGALAALRGAPTPKKGKK